MTKLPGDNPMHSAELLHAVVNGTSDLVYAKDLEGRYLLINREAAQWYGKQAEEILGLEDSDLFPDEVVQVLRENDHRILVSGANFTIQERLVDPSGTPCTFLSTKGPLFDVAGQVSGTFSISRDITEQVQAQEMLLQHQEQLRGLAVELSLAQDKERRRIASELHDEIGQNLALAKMKLTDCCGESRLPPAAAKSLKELELLLERTIQEVRSLTFQVSPPLLYEVGLEAAVDWLAEQFQSKHKLQVTVESDLPELPLHEEQSATLYHVVRELLVNVVKHAGASRARIALAHEGERLEVRVIDDGRGLQAGEGRSGEVAGFGLFNVRQRVQHLGGDLVFSPGTDGTEVSVRIPIALKRASSMGSLP